ncbi:MAG TPA: hypothetical protein VGO09_11155, partial [Flavisolibacter sp.]|nr:hypothetical protein [Flavisolibacter sp.]
MKKTILFCTALVLFYSCKKISQLLTFDISDSQTIQIPPSSPVNAPVISPVPVSTNSQQTFQNNHTTASLVKNVSLQKLTLTVTSPSSGNFDFVKTIKIYIGTSTSDSVLLATKDNIPTGVSSIELTPSNVQLDKYIKGSNYTLY